MDTLPRPSGILNTSSVPADIQTQLGPIPGPSTPPSQAVPKPAGDNSAPPAILNPTPATKNEIPLSQIIGGFVFLILAGFAIMYGWALGQTQGRSYLLYIQSFGTWIRSWVA